MKLLFCHSCGDIRKLNGGQIVQCYCTKSIAAYKDNRNAWHSGPSSMLGISNESFIEAHRKNEGYPPDRAWGLGYLFEAFFIPECSPYVERSA